MITNCTHLIGLGAKRKCSLGPFSLSLLDTLATKQDHFYMNELTRNIEHTSTSWIENLALDEINTEESGVINFNEHLNPERLLQESSINIMEDIKERFEIFLTKFNELRGMNDQSRHIKIFKISNTINDFMLFRNALKLVVARRSADVITIGFLSNSGGLFSARLNTSAPEEKLHEIRAHVGAFNNISWRFQGEPVDLDALVKHYLTEFIKHSAR